jgi:hypothetical protein
MKIEIIKMVLSIEVTILISVILYRLYKLENYGIRKGIVK